MGQMQHRMQTLQDMQVMDLVSVHEADPEAKFVFASPSFHNIFDCDPETLLGASMFNFIFKEDHDRVRASMKAVLVEGGHSSVLYRFLYNDDKATAWLETSIQLTNDGAA